jgi:hypothetical protein
MRSIFRALLALVLYGFLSPEQAHAYIDPGIGSMLLQGLAAGAISLIVFWRGLRRSIVSFFKGKKDADS